MLVAVPVDAQANRAGQMGFGSLRWWSMLLDDQVRIDGRNAGCPHRRGREATRRRFVLGCLKRPALWRGRVHFVAFVPDDGALSTTMETGPGRWLLVAAVCTSAGAGSTGGGNMAGGENDCG